MKVIVDNKIPYIKGVIEQLADEVEYIPGAEITPETVREADALIVRTRTRCDRNLLEKSRVAFVATATIGYDHIDTSYCREAGIDWYNAQGCNAASVAQYVQSSLLLLQKEKGMPLNELTLGIVGVGHVGIRVAAAAQALGMKVLLNDPPRQEVEHDEAHFSPLRQLAEACDVITFHTPLIREGRFCSYHLADASFFESLQRKPVIINSSRGGVIDGDALKQALDKGTVSAAILDVWENEPNLDLELLEKVYIGTPHIAGYSADGKANATRQVLDAFCRHFQLQGNYTITPPAPACNEIHASSRAEALLQIYNPKNDSDALKADPSRFEWLRGNYPLRREELAYHIMLP